MTKARDIADFKFENITDTGTEGTRVATGTTAQRGSTQGQLRFNTTTGLAEYYTGTEFKAIDSPPTIQSISPTTEPDANANIVITGSGFSSGATVKFVGNDGTEYSSPSVTYNSNTQLTATTPSSALPASNEPYDIKVTNVSGLSNTLADALDAGGVPAWNTASGQIGGTLFEGETINVSVSATDPDGTTVTYSEVTSVLGSNGLSLNSSTGAITGTLPSVSSDTTISFTIRATSGNDSTDRAFNIVNKNNNPPVFNVASGSLGTLFDAYRTSSALTAITATDPEGTAVTFAITTGSAPTGLTLNSDGTWSGTADAVGSDTTSTFTVTASSGGQTATRQYSITVKAPVLVAFTSGSGTWNRPSGMSASTQIKLLIVAGGGGAGGARTSDPAGGGGAGGLILVTNFVTAQSSYTYSVGGGGNGGNSGSAYGSNGSNSTFASSGSGTFTANGGGGGGGTTYGQSVHGNAGGSGGGSGSYNGNGGASNQTTSFTIDGTTYSNVGFGNSGSGGNGGAGGGANGAGSGNTGGAGKNVSSDFGTSYGNSGVFSKGGNDGSGGDASANTGNGGGSRFGTYPGGNGGSGIILIAY
jgi:hypothetical protein